jgi:hypothetical protein
VAPHARTHHRRNPGNDQRADPLSAPHARPPLRGTRHRRRLARGPHLSRTRRTCPSAVAPAHRALSHQCGVVPARPVHGSLARPQNGGRTGARARGAAAARPSDRRLARPPVAPCARHRAGATAVGRSRPPARTGGHSRTAHGAGGRPSGSSGGRCAEPSGPRPGPAARGAAGSVRRTCQDEGGRTRTHDTRRRCLLCLPAADNGRAGLNGTDGRHRRARTGCGAMDPTARSGPHRSFGHHCDPPRRSRPLP